MKVKDQLWFGTETTKVQKNDFLKICHKVPTKERLTFLEGFMKVCFL